VIGDGQGITLGNNLSIPAIRQKPLTEVRKPGHQFVHRLPRERNHSPATAVIGRNLDHDRESPLETCREHP
jgi:hypothetical protein